MEETVTLTDHNFTSANPLGNIGGNFYCFPYEKVHPPQVARRNPVIRKATGCHWKCGATGASFENAQLFIKWYLKLAVGTVFYSSQLPNYMFKY